MVQDRNLFLILTAKTLKILSFTSEEYIPHGEIMMRKSSILISKRSFRPQKKEKVFGKKKNKEKSQSGVNTR